MKIGNERMAALLHAQNLAFDKGFSLDNHLETTWKKTPESTRSKWRKRAITFGNILEQEVMEHV